MGFSTATNHICAFILAAGHGTRLMPLTAKWPKCMMPIQGRPLLEAWIEEFISSNVREIYLNTHSNHEIIESFLDFKNYKIIQDIYEPKLLGTAASLRENYSKLRGKTVILVHADNCSDVSISQLINYHFLQKSSASPITMLTFNTESPENCGIAVCDENDLLVNFYEKSNLYYGNRANGAIYVLDPSVIDFINDNKGITDFSTQVIPAYINKIKCWHYSGFHLDIGNFENLKKSQFKSQKYIFSNSNLGWSLHKSIVEIDALLKANT